MRLKFIIFTLLLFSSSILGLIFLSNFSYADVNPNEIHYTYTFDNNELNLGPSNIANISNLRQKQNFSYYYPGTFDFNDVSIGNYTDNPTSLEFVDSVALYNGNLAIVDWQGHNHCLRIQDNTAAGGDPYITHLETQSTSGTREFYIGSNDVSQSNTRYSFIESGVGSMFMVGIRGGDLDYLDSTGWHTIQVATDNTWYHIKAQWYADNTFDIHVNGVLEIDGALDYVNQSSGVNAFQTILTQGFTEYAYLDAWGDPNNDINYSIGDNMKPIPVNLDSYQVGQYNFDLDSNYEVPFANHWINDYDFGVIDSSNSSPYIGDADTEIGYVSPYQFSESTWSTSWDNDIQGNFVHNESVPYERNSDMELTQQVGDSPGSGFGRTEIYYDKLDVNPDDYFELTYRVYPKYSSSNVPFRVGFADFKSGESIVNGSTPIGFLLMPNGAGLMKLQFYDGSVHDLNTSISRVSNGLEFQIFYHKSFGYIRYHELGSNHWGQNEFGIDTPFIIRNIRFFLNEFHTYDVHSQWNLDNIGFFINGSAYNENSFGYCTLNPGISELSFNNYNRISTNLNGTYEIGVAQTWAINSQPSWMTWGINYSWSPKVPFESLIPYGNHNTTINNYDLGIDFKTYNAFNLTTIENPIFIILIGPNCTINLNDFYIRMNAITLKETSANSTKFYLPTIDYRNCDDKTTKISIDNKNYLRTYLDDNSTNDESIQLTFDIDNRLTTNYSMAVTDIYKSNWDFSNRFSVLFNDSTTIDYLQTNTNPYAIDNNLYYSQFSMTLQNYKYIDKFIFNISSSDNSINTSVLSGFEKITLHYIPLGWLDLTTLHHTGILPTIIPLIILFFPPLIVSSAIQAKTNKTKIGKKLFIPLLAVFSIIFFASGLIPLWIFFIILLCCGFIMLLSRGVLKKND